MLVRQDGVVIGQPAHAWVSGQLARAWGNGAFPAPSPREPFCLAAEQHDVGWADADLEPALGSDGRPLSFMQQPRPAHLAIWRGAAARLLAQSRYAALLVSLHGTSLYERVEVAAEHADAVRAFVAEQRALQERLSFGLDPEEVDRNRRLLLALDRMSLFLCYGRGSELEDVPGASGSVTLRLEPASGVAGPRAATSGDRTAAPKGTARAESATSAATRAEGTSSAATRAEGTTSVTRAASETSAATRAEGTTSVTRAASETSAATRAEGATLAARDDGAAPASAATARFVLSPWPFAAPAVFVGCEGRLLEGSFGSDEELRAALDAAPWVPLRWELSPG